MSLQQTAMAAPTPQQATVLKPLARSPVHGPTVFLSGSVGKGVPDWHGEVTAAVAHLAVTVFDPLRDDWDDSWEEDISNPEFRDQVTWELDHMDAADIVVVYLHPGTVSAVSMLEFGLTARQNKVLVCCPPGFARRGNIQVVCERHAIPLVDSIPQLAHLLTRRLEALLGYRRSSAEARRPAT